MPADALVVDADGHVCEPADLWERGLPARFRERALRLRWNAATGFGRASFPAGSRPPCWLRCAVWRATSSASSSSTATQRTQ